MRRVSVVLWLVAGCPAREAPPPPDPFADVVFDEDLVARPTPADALVPVGSGLAAADQVVVLLTPGAPIAPVAEALGAEVIGRVPVADAWQLAVAAPDGPALQAVVAAARALPEVAHAALNHAIVAAAERPEWCKEQDDNYTPQGHHRCAFETVQAYEAAILMSEVQRERPLHTVRVAVIDSGLGPASGQFDDVDVLNLDGRDTPLVDEIGHGTAVAGLIAADNHDGGPNGIATRAVGSPHVQLLVGRLDDTWFGRLVVLARAAGDAGADVVNASWGRTFDPLTEGAEALAVNAAFERVMVAWPDTVFVMSAGNETTEITATNFAPGGQRLANAITVGGTKHCLAEERWVQHNGGSNTGARVDLAAPAEDVPVIAWWPGAGVDFPEGEPVYYDGTSFAAPIVSAMIAVMRSIDPGVSVATMRQYLTLGLPTDLAIGGVVPQLGTILEQQLIDLGVGGRLKVLIDDDAWPGEADPVSLMVNRSCGGAHLRVESLGTWDLPGEEQTTAIQVLDGQVHVGIGPEDPSEIALVVVVQGQPFALNAPWAFPAPAVGSISAWNQQEGGAILSGAITFTRCTVLERWEVVNQGLPAILEIQGHGAGVVELVHLPTGIAHSEEWELTFVSPASVHAISDPVIEAIETLCEGGRLRR